MFDLISWLLAIMFESFCRVETHFPSMMIRIRKKALSMYPYDLIRSKRKSLSIEIRPDLSILVRAPQRASKKLIEDFVKSRHTWLEKNLKLMEDKLNFLNLADDYLTEAEIQSLKNQAKVDLLARIEKWAPIVGVSYNQVRIKAQKTRWGSCSTKGNLNFNCLLMLAPESVRDYVVIHELCHMLEMNHSPSFWSHVERVMPDYRIEKKWLKQEGLQLMRRLTRSI